MWLSETATASTVNTTRETTQRLPLPEKRRFCSVVDPTINFAVPDPSGLNNFGPRAFDSGVGTNYNYTARWTGKVLAPVSGNYVFTTISDDGSVLCPSMA